MSASIDTRLFFASIMMGVLLLQRHNYCHMSVTLEQEISGRTLPLVQGIRGQSQCEEQSVCVCACLDIFAGKRIRNVIILLTRED